MPAFAVVSYGMQGPGMFDSHWPREHAEPSGPLRPSSKMGGVLPLLFVVLGDSGLDKQHGLEFSSFVTSGSSPWLQPGGEKHETSARAFGSNALGDRWEPNATPEQCIGGQV